jgi:hypothetical protein
MEENEKREMKGSWGPLLKQPKKIIHARICVQRGVNYENNILTSSNSTNTSPHQPRRVLKTITELYAPPPTTTNMMAPSA